MDLLLDNPGPQKVARARHFTDEMLCPLPNQGHLNTRAVNKSRDHYEQPLLNTVVKGQVARKNDIV